MNSENYPIRRLLSYFRINSATVYVLAGFVPILQNGTHSQAPRQVYFSVFSFQFTLFFTLSRGGLSFGRIIQQNV